MSESRAPSKMSFAKTNLEMKEEVDTQLNDPHDSLTGVNPAMLCLNSINCVQKHHKYQNIEHRRLIITDNPNCRAICLMYMDGPNYPHACCASQSRQGVTLCQQRTVCTLLAKLSVYSLGSAPGIHRPVYFGAHSLQRYEGGVEFPSVSFASIQGHTFIIQSYPTIFVHG